MLNFEKVQDYNKRYNSNKENLIIEEEITQKGLYEACISKDLVNSIKSDYDIELPETSLYDQKDSLSCWIIAALDFIKRNVTQNMNIKNNNFNLSVNYIQFFHRLEKMNYLYEIVIHENIDTKKVNQSELVDKYIGIFGTFDSITEIIEKYGIVPELIMPMTINNYNNPYIVDKILKEKIRKDILEILKTKENKGNLEELKNKLVEENYIVLSKIFGNPPIIFNYNYEDNDGNSINLKNISPIEFSKKYITENLRDYILIKNDDLKPFYKTYEVEDTISSIYNKNIKYLNLPIEYMKELCVKQLQDGLPVWFGCDFKTVSGTYDNYSGILDKNLYDYNKFLGIEILSKGEKVKFNDITYQHSMLIEGVKLENSKPITWKVKNSYGEKYNRKGYFAMTDSYFNDFVMMIQINKKYLNNECLEVL